MNILDSLVLEVSCPSCQQRYEVSIANVLEAQEMLNEGRACRSETECPPLYLGALLDQDDVRELQEAYMRLAAQAENRGASLHLKKT
jgi:hypothetical protein